MERNFIGLGSACKLWAVAVLAAALLSVGAGCSSRTDKSVAGEVRPMSNDTVTADTTTTAAARLAARGLVPDSCRQLVVVDSAHAVRHQGKTFHRARMRAFSRTEQGAWQQQLAESVVNLGAAGLAAPGKKREGDRRTPSGCFPLTEAFGYEADVSTDMPYTVVGPRHVWVSDTHSPDYNRMLTDRDGRLLANRDNERLRRDDVLYRHALVVGYNMQPAVSPLGSAIFLHVERQRFHQTAGCVSMPDSVLTTLLGWLRPDCHPHIYLTQATP